MIGAATNNLASTANATNSGVTNPVVKSFTPPGRLTDFTDAEKQNWNQTISNMFDSSVMGRTSFEDRGYTYTYTNDAPRPQFFNPATTNRSSDLAEKKITWIGFPKLVKSSYPTDEGRWKAADDNRLDNQDEYCEWSVARNSDNKITSVTFTCEGPEYWIELGKTNKPKVLELYQQYISPDVKYEDLFDSTDTYMPKNKWNTDSTNGAMHLIQANNFLSAEVEIAGGASIIRKKDGKILTDQQALIQCGKYGERGRNSDPTIGANVNTLARTGAKISLRDPVGIYFDSLNTTGWKTPDGSDPKSYWKILRGDPGTPGNPDSALPVRAVYEVPSEKGFTVSDIKIGNNNINYGGQIADFVNMKLYGIAQDFGKTPVSVDTAFPCVTITKVPTTTAAATSHVTTLFKKNLPGRYQISFRSHNL